MARSYTTLSWLGVFIWSTTLGAAQSPPPLDVIHIPLTASSDNQRYFANVNMSVGAQTQRFGFALSTTTGYTVVADSSCASCANNSIPTYNANQSNTAKAIGSGQQQQSVPIAGGAVDAGGGILSKEDCALHQANGSFWQYPNQTIVQANSSAVFQAGVSGLIGLGTNTANFGDNVLAGWLSRNPAQPNFTFGLALNPLPGTQAQTPVEGDPSDTGASAGTLHMQLPDPLSFTGDIQWQTVQNMAPAAGESTNSTGVTPGNLGDSSWLIQMDGWNFTAGEAQTSNKNGGLAAVEPFFANIFLPAAQATQLYASLPGSQPLPRASSDIGQAYSVPCDADMTFSVVLSEQEYLVPKEALVVQAGDGSCTGAIEGWADATVTNYLLGSRFISTVYMVFQVGQPPAAQQKVGLARRVKGTTSKPPVGGIVGGVVGGVAFLLIAGGVLFWWVRRHKRRSAPVAGEHGPQRSETSDEKVGSGLSSSKEGYVVDHWAPSSVPHTPSHAHSTAYTGSSPEPYYPTVGTPSTGHFSTPVSANTHETFFTPPGTATSETFLAPPSPKLKVNQWVKSTSDNRGPARSRVPTEFDYGNRGEPGQLAPPTFPDDAEGGTAATAGSHDSYASSTLAAPSESWKPDHFKAAS